MENPPHLHVVTPKVHGKRAAGLEVLVLSKTPSARKQNGRARYHLLVVGGIFGVVFTIRRVIIPIWGFKLVSNHVGQGNPCGPADTGQNRLDLVKDLWRRGHVEGQWGVVWLLVVFEPGVYHLLLLPKWEEVAPFNFAEVPSRFPM